MVVSRDGLRRASISLTNVSIVSMIVSNFGLTLLIKLSEDWQMIKL